MLLLVILIVLTVQYITYVITRSEFPLMLYLRDRVFARFGEGSWQAYLATCPWCAAIYVSAAITGITTLTTELAYPLLVWPATAAAVGTLMEVVQALWSSQSRSR